MKDSQQIKEKQQLPLTESMRSIFEFENILKNLFVLIVNYENELYNESINKKIDLSIYNLSFKDLEQDVLLLHKKVQDIIKNNYDLKQENKEKEQEK